MRRVRDFDAAAYFPGRYLIKDQAKYFALRSFFVETGLRPKDASITAEEHLEWWRTGIHGVVYDDSTRASAVDEQHTNEPTLRLLAILAAEHHWDPQLFDNVIDARLRDLSVAQYETIGELQQQAELSCGSLLRLMLSTGSTAPQQSPSNEDVIRHVGIGHGLAQQLRYSIPLLSTARRLVIPAELTTRYNVRSPRFLLSALAQGGDAQCQQAMQNAVRDISNLALEAFDQARSSPAASSVPVAEVAALTVPSEVWLERLADHEYQLTHPDLRTVGLLERGKCAARSVAAYVKKEF